MTLWLGTETFPNLTVFGTIHFLVAFRLGELPR